jgi:hypothetical protein
MKGILSLVIVVAIGMAYYAYTLKEASPGAGMVATQAIDLTGVQMDLNAIAQAERMYFTQNGSYADLPTLMSNGTMNIARTSRGGYNYTVEPSGAGFTATARYTAPPLDIPKGVTPPRFPTITVDQTMQIHQSD